MSADLSQLKPLLTQQTGQDMHRHIFVLAGEESWQHESLKIFLSGHEQDALWVAEQAVNLFPCVEYKKAQGWLGKEKRFVIFDANNGFNADSFAAISGIVIGGGVLFLLMPELDKLDEVYSSAFGRRLLKNIRNTNEIILIEQNKQDFSFYPSEVTEHSFNKCKALFLTQDQQLAVETIEQTVLADKNDPVVLVSDRGRGKSAALGIAAASLIKYGIKKIAVTAPRLRATDIIFKHAVENLPGAESSRGNIKLGECEIQFYSPDQLIHEAIQADLLLVDEAAAIPVPLLVLFLENYPQCVYATTVHGYEGTGRGFALRFNKILNQEKPGWVECKMQTPIRWAENDPLEKWMFNLLCLDAEIVEPAIIKNINNELLEYLLIKRSELLENETLLKEVFSLLVLAHYRTQPGDLVRLLDDDNLYLFVVMYKQHILAVALVSHEGGFNNMLSTKIYRGERRPPGHLLAQALTYHCGIESAAMLDYSRVMRIAVHPALQHQGIGTGLLQFIIKHEKQSGYDAIGASFGMNKALLKFWRACGFNVVRIGFKREQTSGEHAAIMLLALSKEGRSIYNQAEVKFLKQLPYWFKDILSDLEKDMKEVFPFSDNKEVELSTEDLKDLQSYIKYSRLFELCIYAISRLVDGEKILIESQGFPVKFRDIIKLKIEEHKSWKKIATTMNLTGKNDALKLFHQAILYLFEHSQLKYK